MEIIGQKSVPTGTSHKDWKKCQEESSGEHSVRHIVQNYKRRKQMSAIDPIVICPICLKKYLPIQDLWVELPIYLYNAIQEKDIPVEYHRCNLCLVALLEQEKEAHEKERDHLFKLWSN